MRELEARDHGDLVGLGAHGRAEVTKRPGCAGNGLGAAIEQAIARALHDLGLQHATVVVHGQDHDQLAVELLAALLGKVLRALVLDLAAQPVVVDGVGLLARGRADVALARAGVFLVDALFYLGQQLDQLAAPFFLLFLGAAFAGLARVGLGQYGQLLAHLGQQLGLLLQHLIHLALGFLQVVANGGQGRVGQGAGGAALGRLAPAGERGLGDGLGLVRAFAGLGVDQDDLERRVLEHAVEALRVDEAHREQQRVQGDRYAQRDLQRGEAQEEGGDFHRRAAPR